MESDAQLEVNRQLIPPTIADGGEGWTSSHPLHRVRELEALAAFFLGQVQLLDIDGLGYSNFTLGGRLYRRASFASLNPEAMDLVLMGVASPQLYVAHIARFCLKGRLLEFVEIVIRLDRVNWCSKVQLQIGPWFYLYMHGVT